MEGRWGWGACFHFLLLTRHPRGGELINHKRGISSTFTRVLAPLLTPSCGLRGILVATETHGDARRRRHSVSFIKWGEATADD